jgi:4-carboxymuconolactone decarboxylase
MVHLAPYVGVPKALAGLRVAAAVFEEDGADGASEDGVGSGDTGEDDTGADATGGAGAEAGWPEDVA